MNYKEFRKKQKERKEKEMKLMVKGFLIGILLSVTITTICINKTPKIEDYMIVYADKGDTITSICQEEYSNKTIDKIGMNTLRTNCITENKNEKLKIGERILVPIYKK